MHSVTIRGIRELAENRLQAGHVLALTSCHDVISICNGWLEMRDAGREREREVRCLRAELGEALKKVAGLTKEIEDREYQVDRPRRIGEAIRELAPSSPPALALAIEKRFADASRAFLAEIRAEIHSDDSLPVVGDSDAP